MRRYEIECETLRGFHASLGRGDPCTQYKRGCGTELTLSEVEGSLFELVGGRRAVLLTSPLISRERRPAASRPVGEGSGPQESSVAGRRCFFLLFRSSHDFSLCHPERSEGSRASARPAGVSAGHRNVRPDSSPQRLRMTQKNVGASFCDVIAEPSPTGRDTAGRLSRESRPHPRQGRGLSRRKTVEASNQWRGTRHPDWGEVRTGPWRASGSMPKNLTPNPFPRGNGNQSRKVGF
jgi:hypothetical protein